MIICPICNEDLYKKQKSGCSRCDYINMLNKGEIYFHPEVEEEHEDYDASRLDELYKYENKYFWFINRKKLISRLFNKYVDKREAIIEVGAGTGNIVRELMLKGYKNIAVGELHKKGLEFAKTYGIQKRFQFDILKTPFINEFDTVCLFDVIEHIDRHEQVIANVNKMLKEKGKIIITVPAYMCLWSSYDELARHKRRYKLKELKKLLTDNNFKILNAGYFFFTLLPFLWLRSILNKPGNDKIQKENPFKINKLNQLFFHILLSVELILIQYIKFPAGGSIFIVGEKDKS